MVFDDRARSARGPHPDVQPEGRRQTSPSLRLADQVGRRGKGIRRVLSAVVHSAAGYPGKPVVSAKTPVAG